LNSGSSAFLQESAAASCPEPY